MRREKFTRLLVFLLESFHSEKIINQQKKMTTFGQQNMALLIWLLIKTDLNGGKKKTINKANTLKTSLQQPKDCTDQLIPGTRTGRGRFSSCFDRLDTNLLLSTAWPFNDRMSFHGSISCFRVFDKPIDDHVDVDRVLARDHIATHLSVRDRIKASETAPEEKTKINIIGKDLKARNEAH